MNTTMFWGGGEKWHFETAKEYCLNGYKTYFIVEKGSILEKKIIESKLEIYVHSINTSKRSFLNPWKVISIAKFLKKEEIHSILFNGPKDLKIGGLSAYIAKTKQVIYRRGIAVLIKKSILTSWLFQNVVSHFVFNSISTKNLVEKNYSMEVKAKKSEVIYNALPIPKLLTKQSQNTFTIGNAGRIVKQKGQLDLIAIAQSLIVKQENFIIKIAGEGPLKQELENKISELRLEKYFKFLGFTEDIDAFMQSIDVFVSTAYWEGFGFVLAEAMLQEKPVIAYNTSSNPELIQEGINGYLIPLSNTTEFANKLIKLSQDSELRASLGNNGRSFAIENFEKEKQFKKLLSFVQ